jgi:hypothetical protein
MCIWLFLGDDDRESLCERLDDTAVEDAKTIAAAIQNIPNRDRPDVIAFNEVFHETARDTLISVCPRGRSVPKGQPFNIDVSAQGVSHLILIFPAPAVLVSCNAFPISAA